MAVHEVGKLLAADAKLPRRLGDAQPQGLKAILSHRQARMRRILHGHRSVRSPSRAGFLDLCGERFLSPENCNLSPLKPATAPPSGTPWAAAAPRRVPRPQYCHPPPPPP